MIVIVEDNFGHPLYRYETDDDKRKNAEAVRQLEWTIRPDIVEALDEATEFLLNEDNKPSKG
jgi:hypothetical protein